MKEYLRLLRVKHYVKNLLVFIPLFFGGMFFDTEKITNAAIGFLAFSLLSSIIYIINDYLDIEKDRKHPKKKMRPLASGKIKVRTAFFIAILFFIIIVILSLYIGSIHALLYLAAYLVLNIVYSMGLKNKPIIDVVILASGFVIRILYGGYITDVNISRWLYLVIVSGSLYMGLGKRRNELRSHTDTREVLKYYNDSFLDKNMYVCVAMVNVFYALWSIEMPDSRMIWTVPVFIVILMCYSLDVEGDSDGDPVEVIINDKILIGIVAAYAISIFLILYVL